MFNEKYGLRLGEFKNTTGTERVNEYRLRSSQLRHPQIITLLAACCNLSATEKSLILESVERGFLSKLLYEDKEPLDEETILGVVRDITSAMSYVHQMGAIHCCLASHSVVITESYRAKVKKNIFRALEQLKVEQLFLVIIYNYIPRRRWIVVVIYRDVKQRGVYYLTLGTDPKGDSCFSIYQNNGTKMHFSFRETISGANQSAKRDIGFFGK